MNKEKKIVLIISSIIFLLILISTIVFIIINNNNKKMKDEELVIKIYQYEVINYNINFKGEKRLICEFDFNKDTNYDEIIYSIDNSLYNHVIVKDGICKVVDANCMNHICMSSYISCDKTIINPSSITCMPSGLYIVMENK